ncbi:hypothetical protein [Microvirga sp. M2]|uniref:hypothetical protein n=1 Tax=Microvirga sp. M2 TaxID=3073270 RepID=UPI0039C20682
MTNEPFDPEPSSTLAKDFRIFLDSGFLIALLLGLLLLACVGGVLLYAAMKHGISPL